MAIDWDKMVSAPINQVIGASLTYAPASGVAPFAVQGIFMDSYRKQEFNDVAAVVWNSTAPSIGVRACDFTTAPMRNDRVIRAGKIYLVTDIRADGVGWLQLILKAM